MSGEDAQISESIDRSEGNPSALRCLAQAEATPITSADALASWNEGRSPNNHHHLGQAINAPGFLTHWALLKFKFARAMSEAQWGRAID